MFLRKLSPAGVRCAPVLRASGDAVLRGPHPGLPLASSHLLTCKPSVFGPLGGGPRSSFHSSSEPCGRVSNRRKHQLAAKKELTPTPQGVQEKNKDAASDAGATSEASESVQQAVSAAPGAAAVPAVSASLPSGNSAAPQTGGQPSGSPVSATTSTSTSTSTPTSVSCSQGGSAPSQSEAESDGVNVEMTELESGLSYHELVFGNGPSPGEGEEVEIHFTALVDNTDRIYESTWRVGMPKVFKIGDGSVVPGLNEGVASMKEGGRRLIVVPPHLGYGRFSSPPNVTLLYEVDLLRVGPKKSLFDKVASWFGARTQDAPTS